MADSNIWQLRRQPAILPFHGKLLWWAMVPARLAKSFGRDIVQGSFSPRPITFVPGTSRLSDGFFASRLALNTKSFVEGPNITQYEQAFADYLDVEKAVSFGAGRVALNAVLQAMDIGPGDEVILPAYTCVVVPNAVLYTGARPVYAEIDAETYNLTAETVSRRITKRTKALVVQHTFGLPADLEPLLQLAKQHNLMVIEDCAAALGASYKGRKVGTWGDAAIFSTEHTKIMSTELGGMATSNNRAILDRLVALQEKFEFPSAAEIKRLLAQYATTSIFLNPATRWWGHMAHTLCVEWFDFQPHASTAEYSCEFQEGFYTRLSNAQAILGLRQLDTLDQNLAARQAAAYQYEQVLSQLSYYKMPHIVDGATPALVRYPLSVPNRDDMVRFGLEHNIELGIWFASVIHPPFSPVEKACYKIGSCPAAEQAAQRTVNLPTHPMLSQEDLRRITNLLIEYSLAKIG